jgi:hypothetical protein
MQGRRIYSDHQGGYFADPTCQSVLGTFSAVKEGDYWQERDGHWSAICPGGLLANLCRHKVKEEAGGSITVCPSILCSYDGSDGRKEYHGFLEHGVWRKA